MDTDTAVGLVLGSLVAMSLTGQVASAVVASRRLSHGKYGPPGLGAQPAMTVVRPVCGLDDVERTTLASTFLLPAPTQIVFCAARETDKAVPYLQDLIARHPHVDAVILFGQDGPGVNLKLDNVRKGWRAARNDWVVIADSNVLMDDDYLGRLYSAWDVRVGAVCAPPIAVGGVGVGAVIETAILNNYQARWQYAADALGMGFAQGKSMLFRKSLLEAWGGIGALDRDIAEDAATTKVVRDNAHEVRLARGTIPQPIGRRTIAQVMQRQCRWAQLRRQAFPLLFMLEPMTMLLPMLGFTALSASVFEWPAALVCAALAIVWLSAEAAMAKTVGWHVTLKSMLGALLRELLLPLSWIAGWRARPFAWRQPATKSLQPRAA